MAEIIVPVASIVATFHGLVTPAIDYMNREENRALARNQENGRVQKEPLVRDTREWVAPGERPSDLTDEDWKQVPHIREICLYAKERPGVLPYYWIKSFAKLNKMYIDWVHSIPMDSPIHLEGNYASMFVELHLKHFGPGLYGWGRNRF
jgi:hypothetical protein